MKTTVARKRRVITFRVTSPHVKTAKRKGEMRMKTAPMTAIVPKASTERTRSKNKNKIKKKKRDGDDRHT